MIDQQHFEELKATGDLPSPKGVALAIMRLSMQDDVTMAELASIIRTDPAFVGRLIKAANGVIGFGRRPIASVQDALTVLGMPAVRTMALGFSLLHNYRHGPCKSFDYVNYWAGSLACAVTTQAIALRIRCAAPDEVYALGLLARVGELALATLYPKDYDELISEVQMTPQRNLRALEAERFGMEHGELGAAMLADWGMPRVFSEAAYQSEIIGDCDFPPGTRERTLTEALMLARCMGQLCGAPDKERTLHMRRVMMCASRLELDEPATHKLCDSVAQEWQEWGSLLNVETQRLEPFERLGQRAAADTADAVVAEAQADTEELAAVSASRVPAEGAGAALQAEPAVCKVLLAIPETPVRDGLRKLLLSAGYNVAAVTDAAMGAEFALDHDPDILVMDWDLTHDGGAEMIRVMRKTRIGRGLFVLALAEETTEDFLIKAYELGADDVLSKPVNPRLLLARLTAGQRVAALHHEIERDRDEIRHFAAELAVSNRRLQEVALMDPLTGFPNRRYFVDRLLQEWANSTRSQRPLSCVMVDIDNFRAINDAHGHLVGDSVLRQVSAALRQVLRSQDVVARTGGDEFLVMCPDTAIEAAQNCAERLRIAVEKAQIVSGMLNIKLTISVGVAARDASIGDTDALVRRAEHGMHLAKQGGRNRVTAAQLRPRAN